MKIAFFDFDGTITNKDSLVDFIQFAVGRPAYYFGLLCLSPMLLLYVFKLLANDKAKQKMLAYYFKGWSEQKFEKLANKYATEQLSKIVRPQALERIQWHQQQGHQVVVVSASMESWLKGWCTQLDLTLIATDLAFENGKLSGKFATKNCYGFEKVKRIQALYELKTYEYIYAYGDSRGDKELLELADEAVNKPFT